MTHMTDKINRLASQSMYQFCEQKFESKKVHQKGSKAKKEKQL